MSEDHGTESIKTRKERRERNVDCDSKLLRFTTREKECFRKRIDKLKTLSIYM